MTRTASALAPLSPSFFTTQTEERLTHDSGFNVQQARIHDGHHWNRNSNLEPSGTVAKTLPVGHRGLSVDLPSTGGTTSTRMRSLQISNRGLASSGEYNNVSGLPSASDSACFLRK
ncbi:hypothetical protein AVEN_163741-1 [Araneus ventricosus]|uniref:Uncharacterized protein n=1 Tax=Araneus ventricosus TaxID=182803 RepID=A0A4Y2U7L9_ARAVE|nr:hypothetical protein AVEN_163741-1 [Araneus ventricosus]